MTTVAALMRTQQGYSNTFPAQPTPSALKSLIETNGLAITTLQNAVEPLEDAAYRGIDDPGDAGAIPVAASGCVQIVTEDPETRTLAAPAFIGQILDIIFDTDGGDCVITVANGINDDGEDEITLTDAGNHVRLCGVAVGAAEEWRLVVNNGATLGGGD